MTDTPIPEQYIRKADAFTSLILDTETPNKQHAQDYMTHLVNEFELNSHQYWLIMALAAQTALLVGTLQALHPEFEQTTPLELYEFIIQTRNKHTNP